MGIEVDYAKSYAIGEAIGNASDNAIQAMQKAIQ